MQKSVEVKQVILALCKLLSSAGLGSVPTPETFRQAKFGGGPDVEDNLWELLANILEKTKAVSFDISKHPKTGQKTRLLPAILSAVHPSAVHPSAVQSMCFESFLDPKHITMERWKLVTAGLCQTGYYADWIYRNPREGEAPVGSFCSRDLLLALGWLIADGTMEKLLSQRVEELDQTLLTSTPVHLESISSVSGEIQLDCGSLRRLQWRLGSLRHQGRILLSMQEERARLLHKVLNMDLGSHVGAASSDEESTIIIKDCACLQELCDLLEAYLKWKQVESVFWTWMDSVVDAHQTDLPARNPVPAHERSSELCVHGNRGLGKRDKMLQRLSQEGPNKSTVDHITAVGAEGASDSSLLQRPGPTCLHVFRPKLLKPVSKPGTKPETKPGPVSPLEISAAEASKLLTDMEKELLKKRDEQRRENREKLEEMMEQLEGLVLIPP